MLAVYYYVSFVAFSLYVFPSFFVSLYFFFFFFNDPASPEIYTLSLHDALPIWLDVAGGYPASHVQRCLPPGSPTKPARKINTVSGQFNNVCCKCVHGVINPLLFSVILCH